MRDFFPQPIPKYVAEDVHSGQIETRDPKTARLERNEEKKEKEEELKTELKPWNELMSVQTEKSNLYSL